MYREAESKPLPESRAVRAPNSVGVPYGSDVERATALIREAAEENPRVLDEPEPRVHFESPTAV